jgi:5-formyltetrahydrofolate cyclo-ligase
MMMKPSMTVDATRVPGDHAGAIPTAGHDVPVDLIVTPERVIDCRDRHGPRPAAGIRWDDLTEEKIAAIPLLAAQRAARR